MMKILVDADLILEAFMNRNALTKDVSQLFDTINPLIQLYVTDVGWQKIYNYASRLQNTNVADVVIDWLQQKIQVCAVDQNILQQARLSPIPDFESAVEQVCGICQQLDAIVTHQGDNFAFSSDKLLVWTVGELWVRTCLEVQLQETIFN